MGGDVGSPEDEVQRLNEVAGVLRELGSASAVTHHATPRNLPEARAEVLTALRAGRIVTPDLIYPEAGDPAAAAAVGARASTMASEVGGPWGRLVADHVATTIGAARAVRSHDPEVIAEDTRNRFADPGGELLRVADAVLAIPVEIRDEEVVPAGEAVRRFRGVLDGVGLAAWSVVESDSMHARVAVNSPRRRIRFSASAIFTTSELERLLAHEVGTHVLRFENSCAQPLLLLATPLGVAEPTEEGLAVLNEARLGVLDLTSLRTYALRVLAARTAMDGPFAEVVETLLAHTSPPLAVDIALRAKRGFADLRAPGAHLKDVSYLSGYLALVRHLRGKPEDYAVLMAAKQPLANIAPVREAIADGRAAVWPLSLVHDLIPSRDRPWIHPNGDPFHLTASGPEDGPPLSDAASATRALGR
ncbi:DUF1704 domain-containing protein [Nocardioides sp. LHD-245]|uniref:tyrosine/phenylalanine carboxypeptidase domain-containing protein n=1 Tax=Nocardioides sp. LHD-245 TaxID=3051387 RepID=UPI0027E10658|nr:DUF1704 domain-containing protein [Nocardioides sp. LHD-245]